MRSVVLSIAVHAIILGVIVAQVREHVVVPEPPRVTEIEVVAPQPTPMDVEIYVDPSPAIAERPHAIVATEGHPATHTPSAPRGVAVVEAPARPVEPAQSRVAPVTVPSPHDAAATANLLAPSTATSAPPTTTHANTFDMRVDPDGTAHVTDRRNFQWGLGGSTGHAEEFVSERWLEEHHEQSNVVDMKMPTLPIPVATFDVSDAAMRLAGQDPYAYEKLKALDATRDERAQVGARHRERQLLDTAALVRASLADIARLPADQRAAAIRELYLDCDDSPAGEVARTTIARYVRAQGLAIDLPSAAP